MSQLQPSSEERDAAKTDALHALAASRDQLRDQVARLQGQIELYEQLIDKFFEKVLPRPYE